jgi:hypothetical protein
MPRPKRDRYVHIYAASSFSADLRPAASGRPRILSGLISDRFLAGIVTAYTLSGWPDLIVGLGILTLNADAAREVWSAARAEHRQADG